MMREGRCRVVGPGSARWRGRQFLRGSALLLTLIILVVLTFIAAGAITIGGIEMESATNDKVATQLQNCAMAVRQYIASQLRFPSAPSLKSLNFTIPGTPNPISLQGGHYDNHTNLTISQFTTNLGGGQTSSNIEDLTNWIPPSGGGSSAVWGTAVCQDSYGHQYEVEFAMAFGAYF